jgi:predicted nuclease with TOPRIM domain
MSEEQSTIEKKFEEKNQEVTFTEDELKTVNDVQKEYVDIQNTFGQLSIARLRLQTELDKLDETEIKLRGDYNKLQEKEKKFLDDINEKYGQGVLNPETGIFTPNKS